MRCPDCGSTTEVTHTEPTRNQIVRRRRCTTDTNHRFATVEQRRREGMHQVGVRRTGDEALARGAFDWDRFTRDVQNSVLKSLDEGAVLMICDGAKRSLEHRLVGLLQPLRDDERKERRDLHGWIWDSDVSEAVLWRLRASKSRVAHVLYALTVLGRADREGRTGWTTSADFLAWLYDEGNYPDLRLTTESPSDEPPVDRWYPSGPGPRPQRIVKRDGRRAQYGHPQFVASIRKAMLGRPHASDSADLVAEWVLWGLGGQAWVHTSQLQVGVLDCLRRLDDIAYLRWAAVAKQMSTVTQVRDEAVGLILKPSSRLVFDPLLRPRRPSSRPGVVPGVRVRVRGDAAGA